MVYKITVLLNFNISHPFKISRKESSASNSQSVSSQFSLEFPYSYTPVHPFLHLPPPDKYLKLYKLVTLICYLIGILVIPIKMILLVLIFVTQEVTMRVCNYFNQDVSKPLTGFWLHYYRFNQSFLWGLVLFFQGMIPIRLQRNKRNKEARVLAMNHINMNDVLISGIFEHPHYLARSDMFQAIGLGQILKAGRSLPVSKTQSNKETKEKMIEISKTDYLQIFVEGTISARHCMIRARPGATSCGQLVQPIVMKQYTILPSAWLCEPGWRHILDLACNPIGFITYKYLDVIEGENPDQLGKRMADALHCQYLPYTNRDYLYFVGKGKIEKCSQQYIDDFGWMGTYQEYKQMCIRKGKNPRYYYTRKQLGIE